MTKQDLLNHLNNPEVDRLFISVDVMGDDENKRVFISLEDLEINCENCSGELQLVASCPIVDA